MPKQVIMVNRMMKAWEVKNACLDFRVRTVLGESAIDAYKPSWRVIVR